MLVRAVGLGAALAFTAIVGLDWPYQSEALNGLALFLAFTGCVYPGAVLAQRVTYTVASTELLVGLAILACAWLGMAYHPVWIAVGYFGHGVWDWLHHFDRISTRTAAWFPPACATFDVLIGAYIVWAFGAMAPV